MKIYYLKHHYINTIKWDECIKNSFNGMVYGYSWYLDAVCPEWEALVADDYDIVMPLTNNRKYGINYLYQPVFTQQLGIFSIALLTPEVVQAFVQAIPSKYKYIDVNFNIFNRLNVENKQLQTSERQTYQLDLISSYPNISKHFSDNTTRNIRKANENNVSISRTLTAEIIVQFYRQTVGSPILQLKEPHYQILYNVVSYAQRYRLGEVYAAYTKQNSLCAVAFFVTSHNKSIFLLSASSDEGKDNRAMFAIVNQYIEKNAETLLTLDFEGSVVESIGRFYAGFGAEPAKYYNLKINRLPWFMKMLKR